MDKSSELQLNTKHIIKAHNIVNNVINHINKNKNELTFSEVEDFIQLIRKDLNNFKNKFIDKKGERRNMKQMIFNKIKGLNLVKITNDDIIRVINDKVPSGVNEMVIKNVGINYHLKKVVEQLLFIAKRNNFKKDYEKLLTLGV